MKLHIRSFDFADIHGLIFNTLNEKVKIFNNTIFSNMSSIEMGIIDGQIKNFDKFYRKYEYAQNEDNIKMEGV